jgi:hypothetical protein
MRDQEIGMEIVNDLMGVQTVLPVGKTAKLYNVSGDIADDVSISIDGQASYSPSTTLTTVRWRPDPGIHCWLRC